MLEYGNLPPDMITGPGSSSELSDTSESMEEIALRAGSDDCFKNLGAPYRKQINVNITFSI